MNADQPLAPFTPPPASCDCHTHLFGPAERYPFIPDSTYIPETRTLEDFEAKQRRTGIERGVIVQAGPHGQDNRITLDACAQRPDTLRGVVVISPDIAREDIARMHAAGARGCRLTRAVKGGVDFDHMEALAAKIAEFGWHIVVFATPDQLLELEPRLSKLPVPVVLDHLCRVPAAQGVQSLAYAAALRLLATGNCWIKLSAPYRWSEQAYPFTDMLPVIRGYVDHRPDRLLWASDWPHPNFTRVPVDDQELVNAIPLWLPTEALRQTVLVDNPARLYDFPLS